MAFFMKIHQLYTDSSLRNFTYILAFNDKTAFVIDPWSELQVNDFLEKNELSLITIINTHEHWDHTQGNKALIDQHGCEVWAHENGKGKIPGLSRLLKANEIIQLDQKTRMQVIDTPGHSKAHLCFIIFVEQSTTAIFTGDILFNAGVGNCYNGGDVEDLYDTISNKFIELPGTTLIYPGHEYLKNNLEFTLSREPGNLAAKIWLKKYQDSEINNLPLTTTMADEREINTFLRLKNNEIIKNLPVKVNDSKDVFITLRSLRDKW
jgi:hydroxyacylglutathione hydrolase